MLRTFLGAAFLTFALALWSSAAADDKKSPDPKPESKPQKKPEKKENPYIAAGTLRGKVVWVDASKRALRIDIGTKTIDPAAEAAFNEAVKAYRKASKQEKREAENQVVAAKAKLVPLPYLELQTTEDVIVRVPQRPALYNDKGEEIKRPSAKQLRELKGNPKLQGYQGDFSNLHANQLVQVTLVKRKEAARPRSVKGRDKENETMSDSQPLVNMVIVLGEPRN